MSGSHSYKTIAAPSFGEFKDRGSKFLAYAYPVENEEVIKQVLQEKREEFPDATHHCYAWVLGAGQEKYRANDDGEPAHSAGTPILRQIHSFGLTQILVIVVRYYGGTNLGVPGLIQAYGNATAEALKASEIIENTLQAKGLLRFPFGHEGTAGRLLNQVQAEILEWRHTPQPELFFRVDLGRKKDLDLLMDEYFQFELKWI